MTVRRCCCGSSCSSEDCTEALEDCATLGMQIPNVRISACARVPGCVKHQCEYETCTAPGDSKWIYLSGCSPCDQATACWPCMYAIDYGTEIQQANTVPVVADPDTKNAECVLSWSDGWDPNASSPCPELGSNVCYTPTLVSAGCAILEYRTVCRNGVITGPWLDCAGNPAPPAPTSSTGLYGWLCVDPTSCCAGNSEGCVGCYNVQHGAEVALGGVTDPKEGIIYARIQRMIPCGDQEACNGAGLSCGCGCLTSPPEAGYSYIVIQFRAIIPTRPIATDKVYTHRCTDGTASGSFNGQIMPIATHPDGDDDGMYRCYAEENVTVTFRRCRPTDFASLENKCRMAPGCYEPVRVGIGACPQSMGCDPLPAVGCSTPQSLRRALERGGWSFTVCI